MKIKLICSISEISREHWSGLTGDQWLDPENPFLRHEFLTALENSGSASEERGWKPRHCLVFDHHKTLIAAIPLYEKHHSHGEYVLDYDRQEAEAVPHYRESTTAI